MKYKMIVFDLDGTILNTLADLHAAVNYSLKQFDLDPVEIEKVREYLGNGVRVLMEKSSNYYHDIEGLLGYFKQYYVEHYNDFTQPYNGIKDVLNYCRDNEIKMGVITNKVDNVAKMLCEYHFKDLFLFVYGDLLGRNRKPAPDTLFLVMQEYNINKEEFLFIGDSEVDVLTAKNAGVDIILCTYGFRTKEELKEFKDEKMIENTLDILKYIV